MRALWGLIFCVLLSAAASAQSFPTRAIRIIVPFPPAGITDLSARLVAEGLRATLGTAIAGIVKQPAIQDKFRAIGFEPTGLDANAFADFHAAEVKRWVAFMTEAGLRK